MSTGVTGEGEANAVSATMVDSRITVTRGRPRADPPSRIAEAHIQPAISVTETDAGGVAGKNRPAMKISTSTQLATAGEDRRTTSGNTPTRTTL